MDHFNDYEKYRYDDYTVLGRISSLEEHQVEDARSIPHAISPDNRKENKKTKRKKRKGVGVVIMMTVFCFSLSLFAADILGNHTGLSTYASLFLGKKEQEKSVYYFLYASASPDMGVSYKNASAIRAEGGAGYVMKKQNEYYVIVNAYSSFSDADKVQKRNTAYAILSLDITPFNLKKTKSLSLASPYKDLWEKAYLTLYESANALASKSYAEEDMKRAIRSFKESIVAKESSFAQSAKGNEDNAVIEYKVLLAEIRSAFENLENSDNILSDARYYSVMILHSYALFAEKYF